MFIFQPSDESMSTEGTDWRSGFLCLLLMVSGLPLSALQLRVLFKSLITGVKVSTLVVTLPSELVC